MRTTFNSEFNENSHKTAIFPKRRNKRLLRAKINVGRLRHVFRKLCHAFFPSHYYTHTQPPPRLHFRGGSPRLFFHSFPYYDFHAAKKIRHSDDTRWNWRRDVKGNRKAGSGRKSALGAGAGRGEGTEFHFRLAGGSAARWRQEGKSRNVKCRIVEGHPFRFRSLFLSAAQAWSFFIRSIRCWICLWCDVCV